MQALVKNIKRVFSTSSSSSLTAGSASVLGYRNYVVLISQVDTFAPTVSVAANTLGFTPTWTRTSMGVYTSNNANWLSEVTAGKKIIVFLSKPGYGTVGFAGASYTAEDGTIIIKTYDVTGTLSDNILTDGDGFTATSLEIRIY